MNDEDPIDLAAQSERDEKRKRIERLVRGQQETDFKWLMDSVQGRRFVWRLLDKAGVFRSTYRHDNEMVLLEGMRNMGLLLIDEINSLCPEKYQLMVKEQRDNAERISAAGR